MQKHLITILTVLTICSSWTFAQTTKFRIKDLTPLYLENKFPNVISNTNPRIAEKINIFLQLENLEQLPGVYQVHPFEKVAADPNNCCSSVEFYGWKRFKTPNTILSLQMTGEAVGAYPEGFESYYNFDLNTGNPILLADIFSAAGLNKIDEVVNRRIRNEINGYLKKLRQELKLPRRTKEEKDELLEKESMYQNCVESIEKGALKDDEYYFSNTGITFIRGRCSPHALRAIDDLWEFENKFSYREIENHLSNYGKSLMKGKASSYLSATPEAKLFKGKINGKLPITAIITKIYEDSSLKMQYWYDDQKIPIELDGNFKDNRFTLVEIDHQSEELDKWVTKANIRADWISNKKIIGTWTNNKTKEVLKFELERY
jgi:hypothetical protein